jgi:hypothetical protein
MFQMPQHMEIKSGHVAKCQLVSGKKAEKKDKIRAQQ